MRHEDAIPDPVAEVMEICQAMTVLVEYLQQRGDEPGHQVAVMIRSRLDTAAIRLDEASFTVNIEAEREG